jgi:predicted nucleotidyltransferase
MLSSMQAILGADFVGAYLQGSFAVGDFDKHSDVDFIVAARQELSAGQVEALQAMHPRIYDLPTPWAQHLEGSYFPAAVLRSAARVGEPLWYLDNGSRSLIPADHCNTTRRAWVVASTA